VVDAQQHSRQYDHADPDRDTMIEMVEKRVERRVIVR
jgi:hypothetical protein